MRTVIESLSVSEVIDAETSIYPRLGEAYQALQWWLSHEPDSGEMIDDVHFLYKQRGNLRLRMPALVVLYTFSKHEVSFLSVLVRLPEHSS